VAADDGVKYVGPKRNGPDRDIKVKAELSNLAKKGDFLAKHAFRVMNHFNGKAKKTFFIVTPTACSGGEDQRHDVCFSYGRVDPSRAYDDDDFVLVDSRQSLAAAKRLMLKKFGVKRCRLV
jgi:hypothetical protein